MDCVRQARSNNTYPITLRVSLPYLNTEYHKHQWHVATIQKHNKKCNQHHCRYCANEKRPQPLALGVCVGGWYVPGEMYTGGVWISMTCTSTMHIYYAHRPCTSTMCTSTAPVANTPRRPHLVVFPGRAVVGPGSGRRPCWHFARLPCKVADAA